VPNKHVSHFSITQASVTSAFAFIVGQVIAFVPSFAQDQQVLISAGTAVISAVFLVANSIHKLADSNVNTQAVVEQAGDHAVAVAKAEVAKVDLNGLAQSAMSGNLPDVKSLVRTEMATVLSEMFKVTPPVPPAQVAPATP
jgi:hypothetical protein